jgi:NAD(P)-dependent dehydrogenase (short-subunit alcohol dehydrogenase family)
MGMRFEGKVAIVTGSSKGIGNAVATRLAADGASVVLNGRAVDDLDQATAELSARGACVRSVVADLTDDDAGERLVDAAVESFGRIDLIVSSIGLAPYIGPVAGADRESFARTMVGNTWLCMSLVQAALKAGLGAGGSIVNISAIGTRKHFAPAAIYSASKAALDGLTESLALELGPLGIRVNAVAPGLTLTPTTQFMLADDEMRARQAAAVPLGRIGQPEDIANAVAFLLSDEASYITGVVLDVDGGAVHSTASFATA